MKVRRQVIFGLVRDVRIARLLSLRGCGGNLGLLGKVLHVFSRRPHSSRQAVKLYIKLGKRTGATIRQLGYPTKNALKSWHREFEQGRDLPVGYARSKPKYSDEQKKVAVRHYLDHGRCLAVTVKALGYPCLEPLAAWVDALHPETRKHVVGKAHSVPRPQALKRSSRRPSLSFTPGRQVR
jgi:transposase-like protein